MEDWRAELNSAIARNLHDSDKEEEDMVVEWLVCGGDGLESNEEKRRRGGSTFRRRFVHQDCDGGLERLFHNYFADDPIFDDATFQRRYKMQRDIFLHLVDAVTIFDLWLIHAPDGVRRPSLSTLQKCTVALR